MKITKEMYNNFSFSQLSDEEQEAVIKIRQEKFKKEIQKQMGDKIRDILQEYCKIMGPFGKEFVLQTWFCSFAGEMNSDYNVKLEVTPRSSLWP